MKKTQRLIYRSRISELFLQSPEEYRFLTELKRYVNDASVINEDDSQQKNDHSVQGERLHPPPERYVPGYDDDDEGIRIKGKTSGLGELLQRRGDAW